MSYEEIKIFIGCILIDVYVRFVFPPPPFLGLSVYTFVIYEKR